MNKTSTKNILKRILGIILMVLGIILFISLYIMVISSQADYIKYIVTITVYISIAIFMAGIFIFKSTLTPKLKKKNKEIN